MGSLLLEKMRRPLSAGGQIFALLAGCFALPSGAAPRTVSLVVDINDSADLRTQAIDAVRAQLSDLDVEMRVVEVLTTEPFDAVKRQLSELAAHEGTLGVFGVGMRQAGGIDVYFVAPGAQRMVSRWVTTAERTAQVGLEEAALVVRSSVQSLLDNRDYARQMAPPAVPPPPPPDQGPPLLGVGVAYAGQTFAPQAAWLHGVRLWLQARMLPWLCAGLEYTVFATVRTTSAQAALSVERHPIAAFVGVRFGERVRGGVDAGVQVDVLQRTTALVASELTAQGASVRPAWSVLARATGALRVGRWVEPFVAVGVEAVLNRFDFVVDSGASPSTQLSPWGVRLLVSVGATFAFL